MDIPLKSEDAIAKLFGFQQYIRHKAKLEERQKSAIEALEKQLADNEAVGVDKLQSWRN